MDAVDLYQIHWPIPDEEIEEGWSTLVELKDEGSSANRRLELRGRAARANPVDRAGRTLQPPYSLIDREAEDEILPFAEREGIGVIVYSPMGSGLLTGGMTRERIQSLPDDDWRRRERAVPRATALAQPGAGRAAEGVAERHGVSPGAVAVAWTLRNPAVDGAITGFRRPDQVDPIVAAANLELDDEDVVSSRAPTLGSVSRRARPGLGAAAISEYKAQFTIQTMKITPM